MAAARCACVVYAASCIFVVAFVDRRCALRCPNEPPPARSRAGVSREAWEVSLGMSSVNLDIWAVEFSASDFTGPLALGCGAFATLSGVQDRP